MPWKIGQPSLSHCHAGNLTSPQKPFSKVLLGQKCQLLIHRLAGELMEDSQTPQDDFFAWEKLSFFRKYYICHVEMNKAFPVLGLISDGLRRTPGPSWCSSAASTGYLRELLGEGHVPWWFLSELLFPPLQFLALKVGHPHAVYFFLVTKLSKIWVMSFVCAEKYIQRIWCPHAFGRGGWSLKEALKRSQLIGTQEKQNSEPPSAHLRLSLHTFKKPLPNKTFPIQWHHQLFCKHTVW